MEVNRDEYEEISKRFLGMAFLASETFKNSSTHILDNKNKKLYHLDIDYGSFLINPENKKDLFQEIKIGYNEEFGIRKVPFLSRLPFQSITLPEGFERLRDGSPVVIRDPGKISSVSLYLLGNCEFNLFWYYPVLDDHNQVFMHFKREKIYHIMGEIFRDGHLSQPRELTRDDPKKLCEILDNLEPWLLDLIKFQ